MQPLAENLRPQTLEAFFGQSHLLSDAHPLRQAIDNKRLHSMILWGPSGTGKTTLARIICRQVEGHFAQMSAVLDGVKELRAVVENAKKFQNIGQKTVLFVDEIHRFNKAQQDGFLPHIESGLITLIGATTENPSFELNRALLSRYKIIECKRLLSIACLNGCASLNKCDCPKNTSKVCGLKFSAKGCIIYPLN
jgi:putative ATPase